jgi:hypothetical protein
MAVACLVSFVGLSLSTSFFFFFGCSLLLLSHYSVQISVHHIMPLPDEALTLTGGCNCGAVRYRIAVPPKDQRPASWSYGPHYDDSDPKLGRVPCVASCYCNDCRRATGATPMQVMVNSAPAVTVSVLPREPSQDETRVISGRLTQPIAPGSTPAEDDAKRPPYLPALDVLRPGQPAADGSWLRFFHTIYCGEQSSRSFCGRCGTNMAYHFEISHEFFGPDITVPDYRHIVDIMLGTLDREWVEKDWFEPERDVNLESGLPWATRAAAKGSSSIKHRAFFFIPFMDNNEVEKLAQGKLEGFHKGTLTLGSLG